MSMGITAPVLAQATREVVIDIPTRHPRLSFYARRPLVTKPSKLLTFRR